MDAPSLPFKSRVLESRDNDRDADRKPTPAALLPASYRSKRDHIIVPHAESDFLSQDLLVDRLNNIQDWLWICGRPMPPRPIRESPTRPHFKTLICPLLSPSCTRNHQILISRDITVTENPELHLVWAKNRIFLKPIPPYLLDPNFWAAHIVRDRKLAECARGFLFSYTALVAYPSDFAIAREKGLLPEEVTWAAWQEFVGEMLQGHCYASINPRYWYGELRLSRLNLVYRLGMGSALRGYSRVAAHMVYADLLRDNFAALATVLGYVVIVLTAMQVGLGVERLQADEAFQNASYGFTVFSIIAPLVAGACIFVGVLAIFASNWVATKHYEARRFREMGVEPFWRAATSPAPAPGEGATAMLAGKSTRVESTGPSA
ncbi:hypothetical protein GGS23DRAFT_600419 [Durotheca rogersii]|uniref:uncharacterized protein n=1 Tax=Durotheca rogersii TaxID=419775 RepID=UPI0022206310|nr:uncharacterized protein GGS23DRAFT_600419 [Durotheca rogersii]KAI5859497.1 hypothetical protein GGS23DRAFT_600419 [Durotheca rogersii]